MMDNRHMAITHYIKEIGRGKDGARPLSREQAADLFGQILDGLVSDLEIGAFCLAMRIKGETTEEMCGFLEATHQRLSAIQISPTQDFRPAVVIPSYNGARKLPVLTPLLAHLLAREGFPVALHGTPTEDQRVFTAEVLTLLGTPVLSQMAPIANGEVAFYPTALLHPGLQRLLDVRRVVGLRNPAHSLVKLLQPCSGPQLLVTSYTHPEYAQSMEQVLHSLQCTAMLIRGTEGEAVADPRRLPKMTCLLRGHTTLQQDTQPGSLSQLPELPTHDAASTARYIQAVLSGAKAVPEPIAVQVQQVTQLANALRAARLAEVSGMA
jgi:anthranilate phosphoribosyltransferase